METGMKALTIRQPWAGAIIWLGKRVENRSWRTRYRGPVLIHAGAAPDNDAPSELWGELLEAGGLPVFGAIIGQADLVAVIEESTSPWWQGPYGFVLENVQRSDPPVPAKGKLGLWTPDPAHIDDMAISRP